MMKENQKMKNIVNQIPVLSSLTSRELDVFFLILEGKTNREISDSLFITESAVKKHITSIFVKTNTDSRNMLFAKIIKEYIFK